MHPLNRILGKFGLKLSRAISADSEIGSDYNQWVKVDYPVKFRRRWTEENPNPFILELLEKDKPTYLKNCENFSKSKAFFQNIPLNTATGTSSPHWLNGWLPGLDAVSIYGFIAQLKPKTYFEIGSGNSTQFARQAILDHHLATQIISVDPQPRAEINSICDRVIRNRLEDCDVREFCKQLTPTDILFFDGSHQCFQNSDVTVFFTEVLPLLPKGILIGIHDIFLPLDYPASWTNRYYSEQYMLMAWILGDAGKSIQIEFPCSYLSWTGVAQKQLEGVWTALPSDVEKHGGCFWFRIKPTFDPN